MTSAETMQLFTWLNGQTNIAHLAFPHLLDPTDTPINGSLSHIPQGSRNGTFTDTLNAYELLTPSITPSASPIIPFFLPPATPFNSPALLPALTTLVATPSIITSLITTGYNVFPRPLQHVTLIINNTLYTGLRPAALLNTLYGITTLVLKFGPNVDKRTIGKVISAGTSLSMPVADSNDINTIGRGQLLRVLEVEASDASTDAEQVRAPQRQLMPSPL
ncbi:hypothetical protein DXG03_006507 [Asterophora parasitica]|uniref:Uncharacterized protein n=1 Tax=Asterophora parasitica TaxID=117018 RepID=A0A9P7GAT0_9AGAR|nr:hypothetical protein DXG03_006507 [Asterophora parasitica]